MCSLCWLANRMTRHQNHLELMLNLPWGGRDHALFPRRMPLRMKIMEKIKNFTICWYLRWLCCKRYSLVSKRRAKLASGVIFVSWNLFKIIGNEPTWRWMPSGMSVMLSSESKTVFAAKGSRNILNSAYSLDGTEKTFPLSARLWLRCPPTTYTSCVQI